MTLRPTPATRLIALLGDPISHSLSPAFQNAAKCSTGDSPNVLPGGTIQGQCTTRSRGAGWPNMYHCLVASSNDQSALATQRTPIGKPHASTAVTQPTAFPCTANPYAH